MAVAEVRTLQNRLGIEFSLSYLLQPTSGGYLHHIQIDVVSIQFIKNEIFVALTTP